MTHYDLVVIGAGSGNTIVDERFGAWSVAIVERADFGGTCLNRGCIPSKMFVYPADLAESARTGPDLGVATSFSGVDWPAIRDRVFTRIDRDAAAGKKGRDEEHNMTVYTGTAHFVGERELLVTLAAGGEAHLTADHVVLATGSRPVMPDVPGLDDLTSTAVAGGEGVPADFYTSDDVMRMPSLPSRLMVLGGGYVGVEFAHVFASYGSEVIQVDAAETLVTNQDRDVSHRFTRYARRQWDVRLGTTPVGVQRRDSGLRIELEDSDGARRTEEVDALLVAVGRTPNSDQLDLAAAGVRVDDDGLVVVDDHQRTTAEGVWALGDVSSRTPLKHAANQDARVVQHNLLHPDDLVVSDHRHVPNAVFSDPQVAAVGLTEDEARAEGVDLVTVTQDFGDVAYGWAIEDDDDNEPGHFVKLLGDRRDGRLVGAHIIGPQASVLIQPLILAVSVEEPIAGFARRQYWIHPALTEVVEQALLALEDQLR